MTGERSAGSSAPAAALGRILAAAARAAGDHAAGRVGRLEQRVRDRQRQLAEALARRGRRRGLRAAAAPRRRPARPRRRRAAAPAAGTGRARPAGRARASNSMPCSTLEKISSTATAETAMTGPRAAMIRTADSRRRRPCRRITALTGSDQTLAPRPSHSAARKMLRLAQAAARRPHLAAAARPARAARRPSALRVGAALPLGAGLAVRG